MKKPILTPPVQRVHLAYFLARLLVEQGTKRFHRTDVVTGLENFTDKKTPMVIVGNHQNGMMDPLNICGQTYRQFHWLTRADVFWNPVFRKILFWFNQLPIYRQRDRLADTRERNEIIWNNCIDRLEIGAAMALFPEGNHNPQKTLRPLKRGVSDLLGRAYSRHESLGRMQLIPFGQDYEHYPTYRRRLALRAGKPIEWVDLYDKETGAIDYVSLNERITDALRKLTIDIQPASEYNLLEPYVKSLRPTEKVGKDWDALLNELSRIKTSAENDSWLDNAKKSFEKLQQAGFENSNRVEAWGQTSKDSRRKNYLTLLLKPIGWIAQLPTALQHYVLNKKGDKVKKVEFRSTFKIGPAMFLFPITWIVFGSICGYFLSKYEIAPFWMGLVGFYIWANWGNILYGKLTDFYNDYEDAVEGQEFWASDKMSGLREAWTNYIDAIKS